MNILYILYGHPSSYSFVAREIEAMINRGHNIIVFSQASRKSDPSHAEMERVDLPICHSPLDIQSIKGLLTPDLYHSSVLKNIFKNDKIKYVPVNIAQTGQAIKFVSRLGIDIDCIHGHFATRPQLPALYMSDRYHIPWSITTHAVDLYDSNHPQYRDIILEKVSHIITISEYNKNFIRKKLNISTPISVIRAGIDPNSFSPEKKTTENRIITVARPVEKKGYPTALRAIADIADEVEDLEYRIIGWEPNDQPELMDLISDLGIEQTVQVLGKIPDEQLIKEVDQAELFLLPCQIAKSGDRDGIPVALMEAMALETPPISTAVSGIPELIEDGVNGFLIQQEDVEGLSKCLRHALSSDLSEIKVNARKEVISNFNILKETKKLERIFEQQSQ